MGITNFITQITDQAVIVTILISMPTIIVSLGVGLAIAIFSATTQIQEQTLSFAPKMVVVYAVLAMTGSWMGSLLLSFTVRCFSEFVSVVN